MVLKRPLTCVALAALAVGAIVAVPAAQPARTTLTGAGATFPYPIYSRWFDEYTKRRPEIAFAYQSIGSGGGIRQLTDEFVFFGASDAPMLEEELLAAHVRGAAERTAAGRAYDGPVNFSSRGTPGTL